MKGLSYPGGKHAIVVISFDDVFPAYSVDGYYTSRNLEDSYLGHLSTLLKKHPKLLVTLFTVPDWREKNPFPSRWWLSRIPVLNKHCYLSPTWSESTLSLERHPEFCNYLRSLPRVEIAIHGLHHVSKGQPIFQEFHNLGVNECLRRLKRAEAIFELAGLPYVKGFAPPGWDVSPELLQALNTQKYEYLASARDLETEITPDAVSNGSGIHGLPLLYPARFPNTDIIHVPTNWSITSTYERADRILELGGVLSIKGHAVKQGFGFTSVDGFDEAYLDYLDKLFTYIEIKWGEALWWTTMGDLAKFYRGMLSGPLLG